MISLDTNVLVRLVTNDDKNQANESACLIDSGVPLFVAITVILELEWVLRGAYKLNKSAILNVIENLLSIRNINFERHSDIELALTYYAKGVDFSDALHHCISTNCNGFASFDLKFEKSASKLKIKPFVGSPSFFMPT